MIKQNIHNINNGRYLKNYNRNGFVIFRNVIKKQAREELANLVINSYSKLCTKKLDKNSIFDFVHKQEMKKRYDELYKIYKEISKSKVLKKFEKNLIKFSFKLFKKKFSHINRGMAIGVKDSKRTSFDWHQEESYYNNLKTLHYQFPMLYKCNKKNGTMSVLQRSHNEGSISKLKRLNLNKKSVTTYKPFTINNIKKKYKEIFINLGENDLVMFHSMLIHKSNINLNSKKKVRFAGIVRLRQIK